MQDKDSITGIFCCPILEIVDTLEQENLILKEKNVSLQEQVTLLEKAIQNVSQESSVRRKSGGKYK